MERAPSGFPLMLRTPPGTPATHVRPRPGHEHRARNYAFDLVEPPINAFTHMRATLRRGPAGLPLACRRPDRTGSRWAFPRASHPPAGSRTAHTGVGQAIEQRLIQLQSHPAARWVRWSCGIRSIRCSEGGLTFCSCSAAALIGVYVCDGGPLSGNVPVAGGDDGSRSGAG